MKKILIVDFGHSYPEKIKEKIEEFADVYITDNNSAYEKAVMLDVDGIILGGGISNIKAENASWIDEKIFKLNIPILGICSGMEIIAIVFGGNVGKEKYPFEKGETVTYLDSTSDLFKNLPHLQNTHMFHGYSVESLPVGFKNIGYTDTSPIAAFEFKSKNIYGVIFHPEGKYSAYGKIILNNFIKIIESQC